MHHSTYEYLQPTGAQIRAMGVTREAFHTFHTLLATSVPDSRYKSLAITALEECAMWVNKGITRHSDGTPRED